VGGDRVGPPLLNGFVEQVDLLQGFVLDFLQPGRGLGDGKADDTRSAQVKVRDDFANGLTKGSAPLFNVAGLDLFAVQNGEFDGVLRKLLVVRRFTCEGGLFGCQRNRRGTSGRGYLAFIKCGTQPSLASSRLLFKLLPPMQALHSTRSAFLETSRSKASVDFDAEKKQELGQFRTPEAIGSFMASLFEVYPTEIRLLDAGAGDGALTSAFVKRLCDSRRRSKRISVTAYELDVAIVPTLERTLQWCRLECSRSGIEFSAESHNEDFIEAAVSLARGDLFGPSKAPCR